MSDYPHLDGDVNRYEERAEAAMARSHELTMRAHNEKMAKIQAKRDVGVERAKHTQERLTAFVVTVVILVVGILIGACTYYEQNPSQEEMDNDRARYEKCMEVEKSERSCGDDF